MPAPFQDPKVKAVFDAMPAPQRDGLLHLRELIFGVADETPEAGMIEETLKWGQPAYLTPQTKSGSTIRLGLPKSGGYALYAHCQTTLIRDFASLFPDLTYEGNRAVLFNETSKPDDRLRLLIRNALTYHLK